MELHDEPQLLVRAKEGDQRAYKSLFDGHVTSLYRFLKQFSSDTDEVEEWTQRAFVKAFQNLSGFDGKSRFSSWLFRIAINEMKSDRRRSGILKFEKLGKEDVASANNEEREFIWNQSMKVWLSELDGLKRAVFVLYEVEGYAHAEIASMLQIGESTSRTVLTRAKQRLRNRLAKEEKTT